MNKLTIGLVIIVCLLVGYTLLTMSGEKTTNVDNVNDKLVVLSTFTIIADMTKEVGGDKVESISLTKTGAEIHGYQPTPDDLITASKADVIFENGMNLELWTNKLRASIPDVPVVKISEGVKTISITEDAYAGKPNPHAWMSPQQGLIYVENIRQALIKLSPENADYFTARAEAYSAQIKQVDQRLSVALATLPIDNRVLVTCEGAFSYLAKDYNLQEVYLWAINSDAQGSPQQIAKVINLVKEKKVPAVFCESTVEPRIQQEVVAATGAKLGQVLYVDSLSTESGPASTYLKLLDHTAEAIINGLTQSN
jgi:manganese transport system substrate-binding protein